MLCVRRGLEFVWGADHQFAFEKLKAAIMSPPVLVMPDFSSRFILQTDPSPVALGAVLLQNTPGGRRAISYASRTLTSQERKYSVFERETLAVLFGIEKFRMYVEHVHFDLETDCQALSWVQAKPRTTGRIARWAVRLFAFKFSVTHIRSYVWCITTTAFRHNPCFGHTVGDAFSFSILAAASA